MGGFALPALPLMHSGELRVQDKVDGSFVGVEPIEQIAMMENHDEAYEVDRKRAQKDVIRFVKKLVRRELIEESVGQATLSP